MSRLRIIALWSAVAIAFILPIVVAAMSPLLEWRDPIYIMASFGGVLAMSLILLQPILATGLLSGLPLLTGRRVHRWVGALLVLAVLVHVIGLWITSPPDVIDALLFNSATPFSVWGVIGMWSLFASACLVLFRHRLQIRVRPFLRSHKFLAVITVIGSVVHAMMIEGTMGTLSKTALCFIVLVVTGMALLKRKRF